MMSEDEVPVIKIHELGKTYVFVKPEQQIMLSQLWQKQTAVMIFLRHFACIACRAHASQVWKEREKYEKSGAKIVFIGNGHPDWIEKFREDLGIDKGVILTDPSLKSFKAAGFKNGFFTLVQPQSAINAVKLAAAGNVQTSYSKGAGTHWQMGGIIVVNPKNQVLYHYVSQALGDFPDEPHLEVIKQDEASK